MADGDGAGEWSGEEEEEGEEGEEDKEVNWEYRKIVNYDKYRGGVVLEGLD